MSMDGQQAVDAVADVLWWLRGFTAAQPENADALEAKASALKAHRWLRRLLNGDGIVVRAEKSPTDKQGYRLCISEAQFERLFDGLRSQDPADIADGLACAKDINEKLRRELGSIRDPDCPY